MEDAAEWSISAKRAVQLLLVKQRHIRIVDLAHVLRFVEEVRHRDEASESQSASWPLPPTRRTETGVTSPARGVGWQASCPEPAVPRGAGACLSEFLGGYMLV